ncbi:prolyl endopeptidase-like [Xenia sp. Carnegie-2017]|uniref:prolyl endopeptidase-like n=1 Tax=Xenia sp. Carnegie-2017 TaxID=2897299 RepID=UPI001F034AC2|nr:prolyl endopeptidase-like [Xenia sp. Carnegie-2017]
MCSFINVLRRMYSRTFKQTLSCYYFCSRFFGRAYQNKHTYPVILPRKSREISIHGHLIKDEYSWLRYLKLSEAKRLMGIENRFAENFMKDTQQFQSDFARKMEKIFKKYESQFNEDHLVRYGNYLYYTKQSETNTDFLVHYRRHLNGTSEELLLDEANVARLWDHFGVKVMKISPSQRYVGFIVDISGCDTYCGILVDTVKKPGTILEQLSSVSLEWSSMDDILYYSTFDNLHRADKVWRHRIGTDLSSDELVFTETDPRFFVDVSSTKDGRYVTINSTSKTTSEVHLLDPKDVHATAKLVCSKQPGIEYFIEHCNGLFYILTNHPDGGNYRVFSATEKDLFGKWTTFLNGSNRVVLDDIDIFSEYLAIYEKEDLKPKLRIIPLRNTKDHYTIEFDDTISVLTPGCNMDFKSDVIEFITSSPVDPPKLMQLNMRSREMNIPTENSKNVNGIESRYCRTTVTAVSQDGTKVPVTLFHQKDLPLNKAHPLLAFVYGSYGINVNVEFQAKKFHLLQEGWVLAYCHVRGGGEKGRHWYHQGRHKNKIKTCEDFVSCIEAIHNEGYSSPSLTAIFGSSAGGFPVAMMCNKSPSLVRAAVLKVPFVDMMTAMLDEDLPLTAQEYEEFGCPRTNAEDFDNLMSLCPFTNITKQEYPSMLFVSSVNDVRVPFWMSLKYVSKLRNVNELSEISYSGKWILLKTDFDGGHFGSGSFEQTSFIYAFLYKAFGLK